MVLFLLNILIGFSGIYEVNDIFHKDELVTEKNKKDKVKAEAKPSKTYSFLKKLRLGRFTSAIGTRRGEPNQSPAKLTSSMSSSVADATPKASPEATPSSDGLGSEIGTVPMEGDSDTNRKTESASSENKDSDSPTTPAQSARDLSAADKNPEVAEQATASFSSTRGDSTPENHAEEQLPEQLPENYLKDNGNKVNMPAFSDLIIDGSQEASQNTVIVYFVLCTSELIRLEIAFFAFFCGIW